MFSLFAQAAAAENDIGSFSAAAIAAVAFFTCAGVMVVYGIRQEQRKRELEHDERMKRLELGLPEPALGAAWPRALVCAAIGAGVPVAAFVVTLIAFLWKPFVEPEIWVAPVVVSLVAVLTGGLLAVKLLSPTESSGLGAGPARLTRGVSKPAADPDAIDVVAARG
jgi:hypothetical protein